MSAEGVKPGLPPWGPHVRFRRVQTLVREGSPLVKLRNSALEACGKGRERNDVERRRQRAGHLGPQLRPTQTVNSMGELTLEESFISADLASREPGASTCRKANDNSPQLLDVVGLIIH
jgi:hypothetical protein